MEDGKTPVLQQLFSMCHLPFSIQTVLGQRSDSMKSAGAVAVADGRGRAADYVTLAKPRLNMLVVASTLAGFAMGRGEMSNTGLVLAMLAGTACVAGGA